MKFFAQKSPPKISLSDLTGFTEDVEARNAFSRPSRRWNMVVGAIFAGGAVMGVGIFFLAGASLPLIPVILIVGAMAGLCLVKLIDFVHRSRLASRIPVGVKSGQPMEHYKMRELPAGAFSQDVYVCRLSRTYFSITTWENTD